MLLPVLLTKTAVSFTPSSLQYHGFFPFAGVMTFGLWGVFVSTFLMLYFVAGFLRFEDVYLAGLNQGGMEFPIRYHLYY